MQDPLDTNVNDIDTSYPVIPAGLYDLRVKSVKREPTKDGTGERLTIALELTAPTVSTTGQPINVGHQITHYVGITPKEATDGKRAYGNTEIAKSLASIAKAAGILCTPRDILSNPVILEGKTVRTKVGVSKETEEFSASNKVKDFVELK